MLVFGIDIPLVEIILVFSIIMFILLIEAIVVIVLLMGQINKTKSLVGLVERISRTTLQIKEAEVQGVKRK